MAFKDDIISQVDNYFSGNYEITNGTAVPDVEDIPLGKHGREMELAMLFIDIKESTKIVNGFRRQTAAKMYKSFLFGVTKIALANDGQLRSFNGDGVLVVFNGTAKCNNAVKAAMQMKYFCNEILKPKVDSHMEDHKSDDHLDFGIGIGIDVGDVLIVRGGVRGYNNNDLVWVGNATNYAVKLSGLATSTYSIYISERIYSKLNDPAKYSDSSNTQNMWTKIDLDAYNFYIYKTNFHWGI